MICLNHNPSNRKETNRSTHKMPTDLRLCTFIAFSHDRISCFLKTHITRSHLYSCILFEKFQILFALVSDFVLALCPCDHSPSILCSPSYYWHKVYLAEAVTTCGLYSCVSRQSTEKSTQLLEDYCHE